MMPSIATISCPGARKNNQDRHVFANVAETHCLIVADGVGGVRYGEHASWLAVESMKTAFLEQPIATQEVMQQHLELVASHISATSHMTPPLREMCTTLCAVYFDQHQIVASHVGDSRIYVFGKDKILYLSQDHSLVMRMAQRGEISLHEIRGHPRRNIVTSVLGLSLPQETELVTLPLSQKEWEGIVLCTDGFWELILEEEMQEQLQCSSTAQQWVDGMGQLVGNRLSDRSDNYTCLAVRRR